MSIVLCFYDNKHHMVDSARLTTSDSPTVLREEFRKQGYRVGLTGNILAIHTELPVDQAMALAAQYKGDVIGEAAAHAEIWCRLLGTDDKNWKLSVNGSKITVALHTLGGWSRHSAEGDSRPEMTALKMYVLEKAGLMTDSSREHPFIFDADMVENGYRFLGHVTGFDEVDREWPAAAKAHGNCWLSPRDVIVCIKGELSSFSRHQKDMLPIFAEMVNAASVDTPAPVLVPEEAPKLSYEEWASVYRETYPELARNLDAMIAHAGHPDLQWLMQVDGDQLTVWANAVGYPMPLANSVNESVLGEIDNDITVMLLRVHDFMPQMFNFHYVTSFDFGMDMIPRAEHNRLDAIFSPTMVRIRTGAIEFDIPRESSAHDLYRTLSTYIPASAFSFLTAFLTVTCPQLEHYSIELAGDMSELVSIRNNRTGTTVTLPLMDFAAAIEHINPADPVAPIEPDPDFNPEVMQVLDKAIEATKPAREVPAAARKVLEDTIPKSLRQVLNTVQQARGQTPSTLVVDEAPFAAAVEDTEIALPVVDIGNQYLYTMIFSFENGADCTLANDGGFAAALHLALGQVGAFEGRLVATNRIGRLPLIANEVSSSMGIEGTVRCQRMTD